MGNVKVFRNTDYGAPVLYGNAGYMIPVLTACLVDGYGLNNVTSLTHSNGTVTVVTEQAHGLKDLSRQTISGANEAGYNGEFIIMYVDTNIFTYQASGITVDTATGTITTKSAGAGWTKPYTGSNLAVFRQGGGNQRYLRVDDTTTLTCRVVGYEAMTGVSTGTNAFPSAGQFSGGLYFQKSSTADITNARDWMLIGDDRAFYLWVNWNSDTAPYGGAPFVHFGDFISYKSNDLYNTHIVANVSAAIAGFRFCYLSTTIQTADTGHYVCRSYTQVGTSMPCSRSADYSKGNAQAQMGGAPGLPYPHPVDGGLYMSPVFIGENQTTLAQSVVRGHLNGAWNPLHNRPLTHGDIFLGTGSLAGRYFIAVSGQLNAQVMIEVPLAWTW